MKYDQPLFYSQPPVIGNSRIYATLYLWLTTVSLNYRIPDQEKLVRYHQILLDRHDEIIFIKTQSRQLKQYQSLKFGYQLWNYHYLEHVLCVRQQRPYRSHIWYFLARRSLPQHHLSRRNQHFSLPPPYDNYYEKL